ncbi:MAG TPA: thioredoxin family protein [Terriglobales bacterium]|nr:thioredoxin family protein [Terriglobales bacterium]HUK47909.1 thioredoxin family protein [Terriglobales bacterium]
MAGMIRYLLATFVLSAVCFAETATGFLPLEHWKSAVVSGRTSTLESLYSTDPAARVTVITKSSAEISTQADTEFWTELKARRISLNVAQSTSPQPGVQQVTFQATITSAHPGKSLYVVEAQLWQDQAGTWKLVAVERTDARKLEQPMSLDAKIYPPASEARGEIREAELRAAKAHKRVLVIFGADWCYDCHVLDRALRRPDIAPTLNANFEVVHVDVGTGNKNQDLMNEYQVPMSRGVPALAVLNSSGQLIYSQKNGEFERTRAMGPEDLLAFLNKWKP